MSATACQKKEPNLSTKRNNSTHACHTLPNSYKAPQGTEVEAALLLNIGYSMDLSSILPRETLIPQTYCFSGIQYYQEVTELVCYGLILPGILAVFHVSTVDACQALYADEHVPSGIPGPIKSIKQGPTCLLGFLVLLKIDKPKAFRVARIIHHNFDT